MNYRSSAWTGRAARSMADAFGPYTSSAISESRGETPAWWAAVICIAIVGALIVWVTR